MEIFIQHVLAELIFVSVMVISTIGWILHKVYIWHRECDVLRNQIEDAGLTAVENPTDFSQLPPPPGFWKTAGELPVAKGKQLEESKVESTKTFLKLYNIIEGDYFMVTKDGEVRIIQPRRNYGNHDYRRGLR